MASLPEEGAPAGVSHKDGGLVANLGHQFVKGGFPDQPGTPSDSPSSVVEVELEDAEVILGALRIEGPLATGCGSVGLWSWDFTVRGSGSASSLTGRV